MPTRNHLAKIHIAKKQLGLSELNYRDLLRGVTGKESARDINNYQAAMVLAELKKLGWKEKKRKPQPGDGQLKKLKYDDLANRLGMATPKQLRMIEAMWMTGSNIREKNIPSFLRFLKSRFEISGMRFIEEFDIHRIVKAIEVINEGN